MSQLYWHILLNAHLFPEQELNKLLDKLELMCMARSVKRICYDSRPVSSIAQLIIDEFNGSARLYPKTCS